MRAIPAFSESHSAFLLPCNNSSITMTHSLFFLDPFLFKTIHSFSTPPSPNLCCFSSFNFRPFFTRASNLGGGDASDEDGDEDGDDFSSGNLLLLDDTVQESEFLGEDGVYIEVTKLEKNSRRIQSRISIDAPLEAIWSILTDYERLADFIPGLALSQLLEKGDNYARLLQIGQQNLAFGLKFNAKGILDCYEKELESIPSGMKRDIEFKMIEGDFQLFEGKWSIEQSNSASCKESQVREVNTILSYIVDVKPKLWLPVGLIEGRLCNEIKVNLASIRDEAQKANDKSVHSHQFK